MKLVAQQGASGFAEAQQSFDHQISRSPAEATEALIALRQTTTLGDIPWQELRDTGRR